MYEIYRGSQRMFSEEPGGSMNAQVFVYRNLTFDTPATPLLKKMYRNLQNTGQPVTLRTKKLYASLNGLIKKRLGAVATEPLHGPDT